MRQLVFWQGQAVTVYWCCFGGVEREREEKKKEKRKHLMRSWRGEAEIFGLYASHDRFSSLSAPRLRTSRQHLRSRVSSLIWGFFFGETQTEKQLFFSACYVQFRNFAQIRLLSHSDTAAWMTLALMIVLGCFLSLKNFNAKIIDQNLLMRGGDGVRSLSSDQVSGAEAMCSDEVEELNSERDSVFDWVMWALMFKSRLKARTCELWTSYWTSNL